MWICKCRSTSFRGTATISILSPDDVIAARDRVNMLARLLKTGGEALSIDQLRADVAIGLLTGRIASPESRAGSVNISVDLTTLAELEGSPA